MPPVPHYLNTKTVVIELQYCKKVMFLEDPGMKNYWNKLNIPFLCSKRYIDSLQAVPGDVVATVMHHGQIYRIDCGIL